MTLSSKLPDVGLTIFTARSSELRKVHQQLDDHCVLRFCFAKNDATLKEAAEKLCRI